MKKISVIFLTIIILLTISVLNVKAADESTSSSDLIDKLKQIEVLKEKIATKVAEIRNNEKGAILGIIKKIENKTLTINSKKGDQTAYFSDDTEVFSLLKSTKTATSSFKLNEGDRITVLGYLGTDKTSINSKYIYVMPGIVSLIGKISDKDTKNYTITLTTNDGQTVILDIETSTKTYSLNLAKKTLDKSGYSKLSKDDTIRVIGTPNAKEDNRISASRIWKSE